jgi:hypothetical protein
MKKMKSFLCLLLVMALLAGLSGCFVIRGQKMSKLKGTYKLTNYTYTPQYSLEGSYRPSNRDYINDEKYMYEDYLVITGNTTGYYVHKAAGVPAYVKEVMLSYEYSTEDSSKIEYVVFKDVLTTSVQSGTNRVGVNGNILNYSKSAMDLFGLRTEDIYVRWEKVDKATDLSYVKKQLGSLKEYDYKSFGVRGIYELKFEYSGDVTDAVLPEFQYNFFVIDPAKDALKITWYYASKEDPDVQIMSFLPLENTSGDWSTITINGEAYTFDAFWNHYYSEGNGFKNTLTCVSNDISDARLEELIASCMPVPTE